MIASTKHPKGRALLAAALLTSLLGASAGLLSGAAFAADGIVYVPPMRGAPVVRMGGGSRGGPDGLRLDVLVPPHVGRSSQDQPRLYWNISKLPAAGTAFELVITGLRDSAPLLEQTLPPAAQPGLQMIDLAKLGVHLLPGLDYRWSVVLKTGAPAVGLEGKLVADGMVSYVPLSTSDAGELNQTPRAPFDRAHFFGRVGYWYDCVDAVALEAISNPAAERERKALDSLMMQLESRADLRSGGVTVSRSAVDIP